MSVVSPTLAGGFFTTRATWETLYCIIKYGEGICAKKRRETERVVHLCMAVMDCGPPGCSVRGILQARILEWVASSFPRGSSRPRDQTLVSCIAGSFFYHLSHEGSPRIVKYTQPMKHSRNRCSYIQPINFQPEKG